MHWHAFDGLAQTLQPEERRLGVQLLERLQLPGQHVAAEEGQDVSEEPPVSVEKERLAVLAAGHRSVDATTGRKNRVRILREHFAGGVEYLTSNIQSDFSLGWYEG